MVGTSSLGLLSRWARQGSGFPSVVAGFNRECMCAGLSPQHYIGGLIPGAVGSDVEETTH